MRCYERDILRELYREPISETTLIKRIDAVEDRTRDLVQKLINRGWIAAFSDTLMLTSEGVKAHEGKLATKAQKRILAWLVKEKHITNISGGSLIDYYHEKRMEELNAKPGDFLHHSPTTGRSHGYRRSGGTQLAKLEEWGLAQSVAIRYGVAYYDLTDAGIEIGKQAG